MEGVDFPRGWQEGLRMVTAIIEHESERFPVEAPVLDRLGDMILPDAFRSPPGRRWSLPS